VLEGPELVSRGATVTASSAIENAAWSRAFLVDGDTTSHAGTRPEAAPATMLRKDFTVTAPVRRAVLWASALGAYHLRLNGEAVGDAVLPPEWTDYHQRLQYQAYDVTDLVRTGPNTIAATLGDAWYAGRLGMSDGLIGVLRRVYGTKPWLLTRLEIEQGDGGRVALVTDPTWLATRWPDSELGFARWRVYDARREMRGWDAPVRRRRLVVRRGPRHRVIPRGWSPAGRAHRVIENLQPVALTEPRPGVFLLIWPDHRRRYRSASSARHNDLVTPR
jgi:alpha-L-rhamnosidase